MARPKWSKNIRLDLEKLESVWELNLLTYLTEQKLWTLIPKSVKEDTNMLIRTWLYYLDWYILKKKVVTDHSPYDWVEK